MANRISRLHAEFLAAAESFAEARLKDPDVRMIVLTGSVARGDETEHSDIDVSVCVPGPLVPRDARRAYLHAGKLIEETMIAIESVKPEDVITEPGSLLRRWRPRSDRERGEQFGKDWAKALHAQNKAETAFEEGDYESALYYTLSLESVPATVAHALPAKFGLPFSSFRLFDSVHEVSRQLKDTSIYADELAAYRARGDIALRLQNFETAYRLASGIYRKAHPELQNIGFFEPVKIDSNIRGLSATIADYPPEYAQRFMTSCVVGWAFDPDRSWRGASEAEQAEMRRLAAQVMGVRQVDQALAAKKLALARKLRDKVDRALTAGKKF